MQSLWLIVDKIYYHSFKAKEICLSEEEFFIKFEN